MTSEHRDIYKPSQLFQLLEEWGIHAKKALSQNFLIDRNILEKIAHLAELKAGDEVLEIGPGPGALTQILLEKGAHVTAVELDSQFAKALARLQTPDQRLRIIEGDFLELPLDSCLSGFQKRAKVIANLPYAITTPILTSLLPLFEKVESLTIMVQKEFAERMFAKPATKDFSSFSVFSAFYSTVARGFTVSPSCFYPKPSVSSQVVRCDLRPPPLEEECIAPFFSMVRTAFSHRRKMLRSSLKELFNAERVESALLALHHSPSARPEELSLEKLIAFFKLLKK